MHPIYAFALHFEALGDLLVTTPKDQLTTNVGLTVAAVPRQPGKQAGTHQDSRERRHLLDWLTRDRKMRHHKQRYSGA